MAHVYDYSSEEWLEIDDAEASELFEAGLIDLDDDGDLVFESADFESGDDGAAAAELLQATIADGHRRQSLEQEIAELRHFAAQIQQEEAAAAGYEHARAEEAAEVEEEQAMYQAFNDSLEQLAAKLGRPIAATQAEAIFDALPEGQDLEDIAALERAAKSVDIHPFSEGSEGGFKERAQSRQARAEYLNTRIQEMDAGAEDETENGGGISAWLNDHSKISDGAAERLAQAQTLD